MQETKKTNNITKRGKLKKYYECVYCDFNTCKKTDYFRHLDTKKHLKNKDKSKKNEKKGNIKNTKELNLKKRKVLGTDFCVCGKHFKTKSGIWKHKKNVNIGGHMSLVKVSKILLKKRKKFPMFPIHIILKVMRCLKMN